MTKKKKMILVFVVQVTKHIILTVFIAPHIKRERKQNRIKKFVQKC